VTCIIGIVQYLPGRIDHHNVMILGAVIGILRLARSFDDPRAGWSAGRAGLPVDRRCVGAGATSRRACRG
jgi:hypothetical protein